ncbi:MAG: ABC transporter ATP-binding protein [Tenacibaculum sp.]|nr:ABC transporter ATP-binding protein [Tenacibaculum sp.]
MTYFKKILRYAIPYKKYAILNIVFNILYAIFSALSFVVIMPLLKVIFQPEMPKEISKPVFTDIFSLGNYLNQTLNYEVYKIGGEDKSKTLLVVIFLILIAFLLKNLFNYLALYNITFLRNGVLKNLRNDLYKKIIDLPLSYFSEKRKGDVMARIGTDVLEIQHSFLSVLELLIKEPLTILITIIFMLIISVKLTVFVFIFIPIAGFLISRLGKSLRKKSEDVQQEQGYFLSLIEETLGGLKIIKAFNGENHFFKIFKNSTNRFETYLNKLINRRNLASPSSEFLGIAVFSVLLWYGGTLVLIDKSLDGEAFITFLGLAFNILTPAKTISKANYKVKQGNAAAERVLEIIETENPISDKEDAITKQTFNKEIEFKNVYFKYKDEYVLKDFSLKIPKGSTVALVGQSGSGKSTLANLITRFYDVNKGEILIDGENIKNLKKHSLRELIGVVTQDSILFNDSVKNNILFGKENITDDNIIEVAKIANAHEFIKDLPEKYETNIGDGGNMLSGGQKQRLSIARAVLKNPPIMVLDEATSALDTESEQLVQKALENMMKNRTSFVIAHRLSTIQNADNIVVMKKGEIIEQGKHKELLDKKGEYFKLVSMQSLE